jgi:hypothetical protein
VKENLRNKAVSGKITIEVPRDTRNNVKKRKAELEVRFKSVTITRPANRKEEHIAKTLTLNIVHIVEANPPRGIERIEWFLATNLDVNTLGDSVKIVKYYVHRWKIERFHYVLKNGCKVEEIQQRSYERIVPMLLIYSAIALFIMELVIVSREYPDLPCDVFFEEDEWKILYCAAKKTKFSPDSPYSIAESVKYLARLGGHKNAPSDGKDGVKIVWEGLTILFALIEYAPFVGKS